MRLQNWELIESLKDRTVEELVELWEAISLVLDPVRPSVNLAEIKLNNLFLCPDFAMSKDLSGVAERLSAKYGTIGASVFRHSKQMEPQVSFHKCLYEELAGADSRNALGELIMSVDLSRWR